MAQRVKNRTSLQLDIPLETKLELEDIKELYQLNDPYGKVSLSKVIIILAKEKHRYYTENGFFRLEEKKQRPIESRKQTRNNLQNKAKNNDFDNETAPITIEAINNQREMDEDWKEEIEQELKAWRDSIRERKNKGI